MSKTQLQRGGQPPDRPDRAGAQAARDRRRGRARRQSLPPDAEPVGAGRGADRAGQGGAPGRARPDAGVHDPRGLPDGVPRGPPRRPDGGSVRPVRPLSRPWPAARDGPGPGPRPRSRSCAATSARSRRASSGRPAPSTACPVGSPRRTSPAWPCRFSATPAGGGRSSAAGRSTGRSARSSSRPRPGRSRTAGTPIPRRPGSRVVPSDSRPASSRGSRARSRDGSDLPFVRGPDDPAGLGAPGAEAPVVCSLSTPLGCLCESARRPPAFRPQSLLNLESLSVNAGTNVTFTATATGTAPSSYQWRRNATNLAGATGTSLTLSNV